jgi:ABC-type Fe3+/spermidine/putrescine transport system ATPase subunit
MLQVKNISFSYSDKTIIQEVSFTIEKGKNLAIIGESGCGKSTLLKLIYGLYDLNEGQIFWNEKEILGPKFHLIPGVENMKYLAQDFDLMPFITVAENVGKYLSNIYPDQKKNRIAELLELVEMTEFSSVKAKYLSGGQMQRVAIARLLALEPEIVLLDEPFSHIDNFRKNSLRRKVFHYLKSKGITCIIATHDSKDILAFTDETLVLKNGKKIANLDTKSCYEHPNDSYIASLYDDVNELPTQLLGIDSKEKITTLVYPFQLKPVKSSTIKVHVVCSYFKGNGYLNEAILESQTVFFESKIEFKEKEIVFLEYEK